MTLRAHIAGLYRTIDEKNKYKMHEMHDDTRLFTTKACRFFI